MNKILLTTLLFVACAPQNRGPFVQKVVYYQDNSRIDLLETTLEMQINYYHNLLNKLTNEQQLLVDNLLENNHNTQIMYTQLAEININLVAALETIKDLQRQLGEERHGRNKQDD